MLAKIVGRLPHSWITAVGRLQWRHPYLKWLVDKAANRFRNRDGIIQQGEGRGLRFNAGGANAGYLLGTTEPEVQQALVALIRPGMVVYDVGANVGFFSVIAARQAGPSGHVVAFEPLSTNARHITHNANLNNLANITVHREALGSEEGFAQFFTSEIPTLGRFAKYGPPDESYKETKVPVARLDTIINELPAPDVIKMDVEGAEVEVLEGSRKTLERYRPSLLIELHGTNEKIADMLEELGYAISVLDSEGDIRSARWSAHIVAISEIRS